MLQEIILSGKSDRPIKPMIESAIHSELRMINLALSRTKERLSYFENKYFISSDEFRQKFETGNLNESMDFMEWYGEIKTLDILDNQYNILKEVTIAD